MKKLMITAAAGLTAVAFGAAHAESIAVSAGIPEYCSVQLANGSSNTASIAMDRNQTIARFDVSCNKSSGTKLKLTVGNGDFKSADGTLVNYAAAIRADAAFPGLAISERDYSPGVLTAESAGEGYSAGLANGTEVQLWLNMNVDGIGNYSNGQVLFSAMEAPAGTYSETFTLIVSSI